MSNERSKLVGFLFVNHIDLCKGKLYNPNFSIHKVLDKVQKSIDYWEGSLTTIGGAICPDKSFIYPISFSFKQKNNY